MKFRWLLLSFISIFLFCFPAKARKLLNWQYEEQENRLVFTTDERIQPQAKLLSNPTRLVIDLPGIDLGKETVRERYTGTIRSLRVGQFEEETTRIVLELAPGYTLDPQQVKFHDTDSNQWSIELPQPNIVPLARSNSENVPEEILLPIPASDERAVTPSPILTREKPSTTQTSTEQPISSPAALQSPIEQSTSSPAAPQQTNLIDNSPYVRTTRDGFFIGIDGNKNNGNNIESSRDDDVINFDLEGVTLPDDLSAHSVAVNQFGVSEIEFVQTSTSPPQARISLTVTNDSPEWLATFSRIRGLVLIPRGKISTVVRNRDRNSSDDNAIVERAPISRKVQISQIELFDDDSQLLIHANQRVAAQSRYNPSGAYEIRIPNAELSEPFQGPQLAAGSPIAEIRVRPEGDSVLVLVQTRLGYRLGTISQPGNTLLALPIERGVSPPPPRQEPLFPSRDTDTVIKPQPERDATVVNPPRPIPPREETNPVPTNQPLVYIDPGHGGQDPGAIGIGGLREKDIVLPVSLDVAEELRKQGIGVKMTRDRDYFVSLKSRTDMANRDDASLFVSIHANAINLSRPDVNGLETYFFQNGRGLAETIHRNILRTVNIDDRGIRRARFYVLRQSAMPAVLVEIGFVTGAIDARRLKDPSHRRQLAEAIAKGIVEYIRQKRL